jgi:lipopolysaccharide export system permease protein
MPQGNDPSTYRRTQFKNYVINIEDVDRSLKRSERSYRGDREMSVKMMQDRIVEIRADITNVETKMAEMAEAQMHEVFQLLVPAARDTVLNRVDGAASTIQVGSRNRSVRVVSTSTGNPSPGSRSKPGVTRRALESQKEIKASYLKQINRYRVEIHKKYSIPFACVIFVLIGSPLAIRMGRSGMNVAIGLSILVFLVYYVCLIGGEKLADRRFVSPVIAMWAPNVVFGFAGMFLVRKASQEQSGLHWNRFNPRRLFKKTR